jgi:hypothetical protein
MTGDCHVRFCERLGVKLPRPTDLAHVKLLSRLSRCPPIAGALSIGLASVARTASDRLPNPS